MDWRRIVGWDKLASPIIHAMGLRRQRRPTIAVPLAADPARVADGVTFYGSQFRRRRRKIGQSCHLEPIVDGMNAANTDYLQVWQQVKAWPLELRQDLIVDINKSVDADLAASEWTEDKNSRRCELIDKDLQGTITDAERGELDRLTRSLRLHRKKVAPLPLALAQQLHQALLQGQPGEAQ